MARDPNLDKRRNEMQKRMLLHEVAKMKHKRLLATNERLMVETKRMTAKLKSHKRKAS